MGFPDRIERMVELGHPPPKVWDALTTPEGLSAWFGERASIDAWPGGEGQMTFASGLVVTCAWSGSRNRWCSGSRGGFLDLPEEDPRRTYVEFTLQAGAHRNTSAGGRDRLRAAARRFPTRHLRQPRRGLDQ